MSHPSCLTSQLLATLAILAWGLAPAGLASGRTLRLREALRCDGPSRADYERMERGYYEHLIDAGPPPLGPAAGAEADAAAAAGARKGWLHLEAPPFEAGPLAIKVDDLREFVLKPSLTFDHAGARWRTNSLGTRGRAD